jgi:hypothetical protein
MRGFEIEMENKKLAQNIVENMCDVQDYKKRMKKEITEYVRLKTHLQRLKPVQSDKLAPPQDVHGSVRLKLKTLHNDAEASERANTTDLREKPTQ